ncbi:uncharacterized protein PRCAT00005170001 [Priceomyces carsonii]|uniref:uncharacterized protein n=1 Tax=Priceomyces carsonii TaxID=28549 RepID=UPI002ED9356F|nr:unnamed protein product [Priceomyces carsonii]
MSINLLNGLANQSVDLVLEDLLVRFVVNVPAEDLSSIERVFFQVEEAQWFYTDFIRTLNPALPAMKMKIFAPKILEKCPLIWKWGNPQDAIARFGKYKSTIPVRGVAFFNKYLTKVLLVKGIESNTWSFPREAKEETGFDASDYVNQNDVIERTIKGKSYKIYLAKNVPEDFDFQPLARNEISKIQWHDIKTIQKKVRQNPNHYFVVATVLKPLIKWINKNKGILSEEELMLDAERKLKDLLGINKQRHESKDAGREILDILQGAIPNSHDSTSASSGPASQGFIQMNIPQHVHNQIPQFYNPPLSGGGGFGNFSILPGNQFHPPFHPVHPGPIPLTSSQNGLRDIHNVDQQPNPESLKKPSSEFNKRSSETNSKEILSILNRKPLKNASQNSPTISSSAEAAKNRSKAQTLLDLFGKKQEPTILKEDLNSAYGASHQPSNELEGSIKLSGNGYDKGKKVTLLKKPEHGDNGVLELQGERKPAALFLQLINEDKKDKLRAASSNDLLSILNQEPKSESKVDVPVPLNNSVEAESFGDYSNENFDDFDDFELFEDPHELYENFGVNTRNTFRNFDVDSDDDLDHISAEPHTVSKPENNHHKDADINTTVDSREEPKKTKLRILKPGESLDNLFRIEKDKKPEQVSTQQSAGQSLLQLLNGGKALNSEPEDDKTSAGESISSVSRENEPRQHATSAAANLLSLLGNGNGKSNKNIRPQDNEETRSPIIKRENTTNTAVGGLSGMHSAAQDLLSVLKGGATRGLSSN